MCIRQTVRAGARRRPGWQTQAVLRPITAACEECRLELAAESTELRVELTDDDELIVYCEACWQREFGDELKSRASTMSGSSSGPERTLDSTEWWLSPLGRAGKRQA